MQPLQYLKPVLLLWRIFAIWPMNFGHKLESALGIPFALTYCYFWSINCSFKELSYKQNSGANLFGDMVFYHSASINLVAVMLHGVYFRNRFKELLINLSEFGGDFRRTPTGRVSLMLLIFFSILLPVASSSLMVVLRHTGAFFTQTLVYMVPIYVQVINMFSIPYLLRIVRGYFEAMNDHAISLGEFFWMDLPELFFWHGKLLELSMELNGLLSIPVLLFTTLATVASISYTYYFVTTLQAITKNQDNSLILAASVLIWVLIFFLELLFFLKAMNRIAAEVSLSITNANILPFITAFNTRAKCRASRRI